VLKVVQKDGAQCAWCPWYRFCRGCRIQCCDAEFNFGSSHLAIDWDPTALHLRYQTSQERVRNVTQLFGYQDLTLHIFITTIVNCKMSLL
jgi:hypothetical protein